jgi:molybdopterin/thiamine biosynthesis adenylyltransferase
MEDNNQIETIAGINVNEEPNHHNHVRFSDLMWYDPKFLEIAIGGVGGIGSWFATLVSRIGFKSMYLFDMDEIDTTNLGGQLYSADQVGQRKVDAVAHNITQFSSETVNRMDKYTEESAILPVMVSCFDNMEARKLFFESWCLDPNRKIFIDGRMVAESFQIFTVLPGQEDRYRETLFEDSEVQEQPCSAKATSHCGAMIGSMMVSILTNYMSNHKLKADIREVPFKVEFEIPLLTYTLTQM